MGYLPPVKDEQVTIYANRQTGSKPMITGPSPAERVAFFDALKDRAATGNYFQRNKAKQKLLTVARAHEKEITGKGEYFDQTI
ncbi:hypothetical protein [Salipaludibacillus aurantiacus]|uniref:Uncharacterized protein n=1 Tax=Salipaludibacillus aurantiacus TaxID=1601833 RepID=A0A1H9TFM4_9BACI|nr:hypothetical protein [Salipaludibacillus aurantiacus]SER95413.1 hypothetical protein SAMN05518684_105282 [Salipaludibacillus aurantiacus]